MREIVRYAAILANYALGLAFDGWAIAILVGWTGPMGDKATSIVLLVAASAALSCLARLQAAEVGED